MNPTQATTPFGRRPLTIAMVASQVAAKARPPEAVIYKWQVFRGISEGRGAIGVTDRTRSVLNALLTFHPETTLTGAGDIVVFPSNKQFTLHSHGIALATLRRHLAVLVACGLIIHRESPFGKCYARKGQQGAIQNAFGFDLTPIVARAAEFEILAEAARAEHRDNCAARSRIKVSERSLVAFPPASSSHPETPITGEGRAVFPSSYLILLPTDGMTHAPPPRHLLAAPVECGPMIRRNQPEQRKNRLLFALDARAGKKPAFRSQTFLKINPSPLFAFANCRRTLGARPLPNSRWAASKQLAVRAASP